MFSYSVEKAKELNECFERSMEVKQSSLLGNYDRQTDQPNDRQRVSVSDKMEPEYKADIENGREQRYN